GADEQAGGAAAAVRHAGVRGPGSVPRPADPPFRPVRPGRQLLRAARRAPAVRAAAAHLPPRLLPPAARPVDAVAAGAPARRPRPGPLPRGALAVLRHVHGPGGAAVHL